MKPIDVSLGFEPKSRETPEDIALLAEPVTILDSDVLSELSRAAPRVLSVVQAYLERHKRLTFTSITAFERFRGYDEAIRAGKPYETHRARFEALVVESRVLPFDDVAARVAARLWVRATARSRKSWGDLMIASIAIARGLPLATRNRADFRPLVELSRGLLKLTDWTS